MGMAVSAMISGIPGLLDLLAGGDKRVAAHRGKDDRVRLGVDDVHHGFDLNAGLFLGRIDDSRRHAKLGRRVFKARLNDVQ